MPRRTDAISLFGALAEQDWLISPNTFVDACSTWAPRPEEMLADRLRGKKLIASVNISSLNEGVVATIASSGSTRIADTASGWLGSD